MRKQDKNKTKKRKAAQANAAGRRQAQDFSRGQAGRMTVRDHPDAVYGKLQAKALEGDAEAQRRLAVCYRDGAYGLARSFPEAMRWFQRAIDAGSAYACGDLAEFYLYGWGVPKDLARMRELFAMGAERGDAASMHCLASALANGTGGETDREAALRLFEQAAEQGFSEAACPLVELHLAMSADPGHPDDPEGFARALALLEKASRDTPSAMRLYASLLLRGRGVKADPAKAVDLLCKATRLHASLEGCDASQEWLRSDADGAWHELAALVGNRDLPEDVRGPRPAPGLKRAARRAAQAP